jgi:hypothetical protein
MSSLSKILRQNPQLRDENNKVVDWNSLATANEPVECVNTQTGECLTFRNQHEFMKARTADLDVFWDRQLGRIEAEKEERKTKKQILKEWFEK